MTTSPWRTALTVAGSDSGGGAGIQADLKTFAHFGVFGMSAITAVTAQSSVGVARVDLLPPEALRAQLCAVFDDFPVHAVKVGMLGSAAHARVLADVLGGLSARPPVVLDPVLVASTGQRLTDPAAEDVVRGALLPLATVATPNRDEARVLAGSDAIDTWAAAAPCPVLVTGGDVVGDEIVDVLHTPAGARAWRGPRIGTRPFHGTGCTLASAIAARLALGDTLEDAVDAGVRFVRALVAASDREGSVGRGNPSLHHAGAPKPA